MSSNASSADDGDDDDGSDDDTEMPGEFGPEETLELRMLAQSAAALDLARWLEAHPRVSRVFYPGIESHPQHELARRQQRAGGAVLSFEVQGGRSAAWRLIDATRLISITANLGDVKTTITQPATTTHGRLAVGLEALADLKTDLERGLS
jgi:O-succinylhomoserine sulfhydrylase